MPESRFTLPPQYDPHAVERPLYRRWLERGVFTARADSPKAPYVIVIPPPNVTAVLHMGQGLNNVTQDVLIRFERMRGREALWLPGTDHAGIATQNVVERLIAKRGRPASTSAARHSSRGSGRSCARPARRFSSSSR